MRGKGGCLRGCWLGLWKFGVSKRGEGKLWRLGFVPERLLDYCDYCKYGVPRVLFLIVDVIHYR